MRKVMVVRRSRIHKEAALILLLIKLYGSIFSSSASDINVYSQLLLLFFHRFYMIFESKGY